MTCTLRTLAAGCDDVGNVQMCNPDLVCVLAFSTVKTVGGRVVLGVAVVLSMAVRIVLAVDLARG